MLIVEIVLLVFAVIAGAIMLPIGIVALVNPDAFIEGSAMTYDEINALGIALTTCGGVELGCALLVLLSVIVRAVVNKYVVRPTHEQFLGLAIVSFIFSMDWFMTAFFVIIYIFESKAAKNDNIVDAQ